MKLYTEKQVEELLEIQRGNCYVAILNEIKDENVAMAATRAPEPGQWRNVKTDTCITRKDLNEAIEQLEDLSKMFDDRVSDLYQVKGGQQARHAYMFYRKYVWETLAMLKKS